MGGKDVVSNLLMWIVMVDLEVDDSDESEEVCRGIRRSSWEGCHLV
jgi:hypothetical protein